MAPHDPVRIRDRLVITDIVWIFGEVENRSLWLITASAEREMCHVRVTVNDGFAQRKLRSQDTSIDVSRSEFIPAKGY